MNPLLATTRRYFFRECGVGLGKIALASLLVEEAALDGPCRDEAAPTSPPRRNG